MNKIRTPRRRFGELAILMLFGLMGAAPPKADEPLPELNQKVVAFSREQLGKKVGDGSCSTLAVFALRQAGARSWPSDVSNGDFVWGTEVKSAKEALPGDIIQFRDIVFKGRRNLRGGRWISWMRTYPHHTAVVAGVSNGGKVVAILHQNVGDEDADDSVKKIVQEGTLRMVELQPGGSMHFFRPVVATSVPPKPEELKNVLFEGDFPRSFGPEWSWVGEDALAWRVEKGALVLRPKAGAASKNESLLLYGLPRSRENLFSAEITLASPPRRPGERAGLVCYLDDDHQVRLVTELSEGKTVVRLMGDRESEPRVPLPKGTQNASPVQLRLLVWSGIITAQFRTDPDDFWQSVGRCAAPGRGNLKVGVVTTQGAKPSTNEVRFRDFRIVRQSNMRSRE